MFVYSPLQHRLSKRDRRFYQKLTLLRREAKQSNVASPLKFYPFTLISPDGTKEFSEFANGKLALFVWFPSLAQQKNCELKSGCEHVKTSTLRQLNGLTVYNNDL